VRDVWLLIAFKPAHVRFVNSLNAAERQQILTETGIVPNTCSYKSFVQKYVLLLASLLFNQHDSSWIII